MKQETLEGAKFKYYKEYWNEYHTQLVKSNFLSGFEYGAKWQQERSYSEEEVLYILKELEIECVINPRRIEIEEWFEQFKKR
jgi:hypothetical protein